MYDRLRAFFHRRRLDREQRRRLAYLDRCLGVTILEPGYYLKALRHRSKLVDAEYGVSDSYERLEFLGDAVLDLIITEILFERFPDKDEGFMTQLRSKLVKGDALAGYSMQLGLPNVIEIGDRAKGQGIEYSASVLADIFEALLGALYRDRGYKKARVFIERLLDTHLNIQEVARQDDNYKSLLMEYAQAKRMRVPVYRVVLESGPAHSRTFDVEVWIGEMRSGYGSGKSKKLAEQEAAKVALDWIKERESEIGIES